MTNCVNCGAPLHGNVCEYCGTEYNLKHIDEDSAQNSHEDIEVWTDCNGIIHMEITN